ncbi:hypothetical protein FDN13_02610 [Caloramator sp. E03]|uniref:hypothetical protein n=1 Tax=Caloramator sp. E03 TaxID=2576307 RepID=UPI0011106117|nr:hypothetical protein [Caloramator sp. E03]QCX32682.1 hypothetical protein FDN13_02610 [Caloramator sp. E03]
MLKGIFISLLVHRFQIANSKPKRAINLYYLIWILTLFFRLRWIYEVYFISFIVISTYYLFEAFGYTALGKGGINVIGFISGLVVCEVSAFNILFLVSLTLMLIIYNIFFDNLKLGFNKVINSNLGKNINHKVIVNNRIFNFIKSIILELKLW